jgi:oxepin-CoA hydrolase/3-oxo-5,6-dehydrosuberyl-CoA semialdehyde dehydrogenase
MKLRSYCCGRWIEGKGAPAILVNPATEEPLAETSTEGVDFRAALDFARTRGGPALRGMSFAARGELLGKLGKLLHGNRDALIELAVANGGNTRGDAKFDIDGASATFAFYAGLGEKLGDRRLLVDGELVQLGRSSRFFGQHVWLPREGAAIHVNAFNFPAWGFGEKAAVALLAGVPVVTKPATSTALVAHRIVELAVDAGVLPEGALTFIAGSVGDLLDHLTAQDVLAFTGSSDTGRTLRSHAAVVRGSVRVNVEADSLNSAILGPDALRGSETWQAFIASVVRDMTQKTGQKCTAIRRVFVPPARQGAVREDLAAELENVRVGNPALAEVTMGPLSTASQLRDVRAGVERLRGQTRVAWTRERLEPVGVPAGKGFFHAPLLLVAEHPAEADAVHGHEVFGPVATLLPYSDGPTLAALVRRGEGSLVSSLYSDDRAFTEETILAIAPYHGRLHIGSAKVAEAATQPGMVLPSLVHGGPGRAGGGEELGGERGLAFYMQRTALQANRAFLEAAFPSPVKT